MMKTRIIASTKLGYVTPTDEALLLSGYVAGICYMRDDFDALLAQPTSVTTKRALGTIKSGHHSTEGHVWYTIVLEQIPKIIAMLLNNEHEYCTGEKSGRWTEMEACSGKEKAIYDKWLDILHNLIMRKYPKLDSKTVKKLAQENARYFISVFTPATTMAYTVSLRQANYLIGFCEELYTRPTRDPFLLSLRPFLIELADNLRDLFNIEGLRDNKGRTFSLFSNRMRREEIGENYSLNYLGSFTQLAQAHRHRTLFYEMQIPHLNGCRFYVPPIVAENPDLEREWLSDMESLKEGFPQGVLLDINERGTIEMFCLKCHERMCGAAQLEICLQTKASLDKMIKLINPNRYPDIRDMLMCYRDKTKCQLGYYVCDRPCPLGPKNAFTRLI